MRANYVQPISHIAAARPRRGAFMTKKKSVRSLTTLGLRGAALPVAPAHAAVLESAELGLDEVVGTGSRISRAPAGTPHPILSLRAEGVDRSGLNNVTDSLVGIPALTGSTTT